MIHQYRYNRRSIKVIALPDRNLVTLDEVKQFLRIDGTADDEMLLSFIPAATDYLEQHCNRKFLTQTVEMHMDGFSMINDEKLLALGPGMHDAFIGDYTSSMSFIDLPFRPIQSVTSIKTYGVDNTETTFSSSFYTLDKNGGKIYLNTGAVWPTDLRDHDAVKVTYVCGFGDAPADVPAAIRHAVKSYLGQMYECRGGCDASESCKAMLSPYRIFDALGW